jgi:hypothetical protein
MVKTRIKRRKQTQKKKQTRRKQRGGVPPLNTLRFRYTDQLQRGEWIDALYPLSLMVLQQLKQIDWSTYQFEGETLVKVTQEEENNKAHNPNLLQTYETIASVTASSSPPKRIPYHIFGGSACEIWNQAYPEAGNLHETTDPTADIDIFVENPYCSVKGEYADNSHLLYIDKTGNYTALGDSYTKWIFELFVTFATNIAPHFSSTIFILPDRSETPETSIADMEQTIGPILVTRSQSTKNNIKIQLSTKLQSGIVDHFLECLVDKNEFEQKKQTLRGTMLKNGLIVQPVRELFSGQLKGVRDRINIAYPTVYKLINHYGRLVYLAKLHEYTVRMKIQPDEGTYYYKQFIDFINEGGFEPSRGCHPRIGCSLENFVIPLCKIRNFSIAYGKCAAPVKLNTRRNIKFTKNNINED